jgi:hypothetical protein
MADMALMREAITHIVRNAMPDCHRYSLTIDQVNFEIESLLTSDDSLIISLAGIGTYICVDKNKKGENPGTFLYHQNRA